MVSVKIESEFIRLKQFLKFASITRTGGMMRELIKESLVKVNGEVEARRDKKLYPGSVVEFEGEKYVIE